MVIYQPFRSLDMRDGAYKDAPSGSADRFRQGNLALAEPLATPRQVVPGQRFSATVALRARPGEPAATGVDELHRAVRAFRRCVRVTPCAERVQHRQRVRAGLREPVLVPRAAAVAIGELRQQAAVDELGSLAREPVVDDADLAA